MVLQKALWNGANLEFMRLIIRQLSKESEWDGMIYLPLQNLLIRNSGAEDASADSENRLTFFVRSRK